LITIYTSIEVNFGGDSKYINSSSLILPIKIYEPEKICPIFEKRENTPKISSNLNENRPIRFSILKNPTKEVSSSYIQKYGFFFFFRRKITVFFFFFRGDRIEPGILEDWERAHLVGN
jgi:hypothetical protein